MFIWFPKDLLQINGGRVAPLKQDVKHFQQDGLANLSTFNEGKGGKVGFDLACLSTGSAG